MLPCCSHVLPPSLPPSLPLHRYTLMLPSFWGICLPMLSTCPCLQVIGLTSLLPPCWQCLPWNDHLECVRLGLLCSMQSQSHAVAFWQSGKEEHPWNSQRGNLAEAGHSGPVTWVVAIRGSSKMHSFPNLRAAGAAGLWMSLVALISGGSAPSRSGGQLCGLELVYLQHVTNTEHTQSVIMCHKLRRIRILVWRERVCKHDGVHVTHAQRERCLRNGSIWKHLGPRFFMAWGKLVKPTQTYSKDRILSSRLSLQPPLWLLQLQMSAWCWTSPASLTNARNSVKAVTWNPRL